MKDTEQLDFWKGKFGEDYMGRNDLSKENVNDAERVFKRILGDLNLSSILEVGSNIGINLLGIRRALGADVKLYAVEPYKSAFDQLIKTSEINLEQGFNCDGFKIPLPDNSVDLVFTNGVLIHIAPDDLKAVMSEIVRVSRKYILCTEYFSREPIDISYRENKNVLFKRDFGKYYLDNFPELIATSYGFLWHVEFEKFDDMNWWILEKKP